VLAFVELVAECGYLNFDTGQVGERATGDARAFTRHFKDRNACFCVAWDRLEKTYVERMEATSRGQRSWNEQLRACLHETDRLLESHTTEARFMVACALEAPEPDRQRPKALGEKLTGIVDVARRRIDDPGRVPEGTARWILAIAFDCVYRQLGTEGSRDFALQIPTIMFLAVSAYFGPAAGLAELQAPPTEMEGR
jgi:AcrR family transcriptional regulator